MLRVKADLQQVVVIAEFGLRKYIRKGRTTDADADDDDHEMLDDQDNLMEA